jgi:hypothetical protein
MPKTRRWCAVMTDPECGEVLIRLADRASAQCLAQAHPRICLYFTDHDIEAHWTRYETADVAKGNIPE